jgi:hypothetical protein
MSVVLLEAKKEYTEQLVGFLKPALYDEFFVLWRSSVEKNLAEPMVQFQEQLENIVDWDEKSIIRKTDLVSKKSGCSYLDDLITTVFVAHMKIMLSVKNQNRKDKYRLQVPTSNRFIHQCMIQCAREFWKAPYLFYQNETENKIKKTQIQMNLRTAEDLIGEAVRSTIRKMLPVKEIVGDVLEYDENGELIVDIEKRKEPSPSSSDDEISPPKTPEQSGNGVSTPLKQQETAPSTPTPTQSSNQKIVTKNENNVETIINNVRFEKPQVLDAEDIIDGMSTQPENSEQDETELNNEDDDDENENEDEKLVMGPIDDGINIIDVAESKEDSMPLDDIVEIIS